MTSKTTTITTPYERATRVRMVGLIIGQHIAGSTPGLDQAFSAAQREFTPQALHVDIDDVRQRIIGFVPHVLGDLAPADDDADTTGEELQQRILACRQWEVRSAARGLLGARVQRQWADMNLLGNRC